MAATVKPTEGAGARSVILAPVEGGRARLTLSGEITGPLARQIETCLMTGEVQHVREWVLDVRSVDTLDLICAFALVRPLLYTSPPARIEVVGATEHIRRTLRQTGAEDLTYRDER
ncbi:STAS domain-containing protein [Streptomyces sp. NPDC054887]